MLKATLNTYPCIAHISDTTDTLLPLLLVELVFVVAVSASEADQITETIDGLIRKHLLPEKSNVRYIHCRFCNTLK